MVQPTNTAEVRAHSLVMRYQRAGTGQPILVLGADASGDLWPELPGLLSDSFRVLVPERDDDMDGGAPDARWISCFLDGLGINEVSIVAGGRHCDVALELALGGAEGVRRVVLVPTAEEDAQPPQDLSEVGAQLAVLWRGLPVEEAVARIERFLTADSSLRSE